MRLFVLFLTALFALTSAVFAQTPEFQELLKKAKTGNVAAMAQVGVAYGEGAIVPQDFKQAAAWLEKAANGGNVDAMSKLGWLYDRGDGVEQNLTTAIKWYTKAAAKNDNAAFFNLGYLYEEGRGVGKNYKTALDWYLKAAKNGDVSAMEVVAMYYRRGIGIDPDEKEAEKWEAEIAKLTGQPPKADAVAPNKAEDAQPVPAESDTQKPDDVTAEEKQPEPKKENTGILSNPSMTVISIPDGSVGVVDQANGQDVDDKQADAIKPNDADKKDAQIPSKTAEDTETKRVEQDTEVIQPKDADDGQVEAKPANPAEVKTKQDAAAVAKPEQPEKLGDDDKDLLRDLGFNDSDFKEGDKK